MRSFDPPNVMFLLSIAIGIVFMLVVAIGGTGDGSEHEPGDHDTDDTDHDAIVSHVLSALGVGRMPLMLVLTMLALLFGATGVVLSVLYSRLGLPPRAAGWVTALLAAVTAVALTRALARAFTRLMPRTESYSTTNEMLVGCRGTAVYSITESAGMVQFRDSRGDVQKVAARTRRGEQIPMGCGAEILSYEDDGDYFIVTSAVRA